LFVYFYIHVWNGHGADSEIVNVSARRAALNRWMATDKRWNKKVVSHRSVVASVKRLLICARNFWALMLMGPSVFIYLFNVESYSKYRKGLKNNQKNEKDLHCIDYFVCGCGTCTSYNFFANVIVVVLQIKRFWMCSHRSTTCL